jgi:hypothetical protein
VKSPVRQVGQDDISLDLLSPTEWRVRDRRYPESDHRAVLGVICRTESGYDTLAVNDPSHSHTHVSLASAAASFWDQEFAIATGHHG